jgi:hypothetical protein
MEQIEQHEPHWRDHIKLRSLVQDLTRQVDFANCVNHTRRVCLLSHPLVELLALRQNRCHPLDKRGLKEPFYMLESVEYEARGL